MKILKRISIFTSVLTIGLFMPISAFAAGCNITATPTGWNQGSTTNVNFNISFTANPTNPGNDVLIFNDSDANISSINNLVGSPYTWNQDSQHQWSTDVFNNTSPAINGTSFTINADVNKIDNAIFELKNNNTSLDCTVQPGNSLPAPTAAPTSSPYVAINATQDMVLGMQTSMLSNLGVVIPVAAVLIISVGIVYFIIRHFRGITRT